MEAGRHEVYRKTFHVKGGDYDRGGEISTEVKSLLKLAGLDPQFIRRVVVALYEAEMNVVIHAYEGEILFVLTPSQIDISVSDRGPGIADIELAMRPGYSTASDEAREMGFGAGIGLNNIEKNADQMKIDSEVGVGTNLQIKFELNHR